MWEIPIVFRKKKVVSDLEIIFFRLRRLISINNIFWNYIITRWSQAHPVDRESARTCKVIGNLLPKKSPTHLREKKNPTQPVIWDLRKKSPISTSDLRFEKKVTCLNQWLEIWEKYSPISTTHLSQPLARTLLKNSPNSTTPMVIDKNSSNRSLLHERQRVEHNRNSCENIFYS